MAVRVRSALGITTAALGWKFDAPRSLSKMGIRASPQPSPRTATRVLHAEFGDKVDSASDSHSQPMTISNIPQEIVDYFIGFLQGDRETLRSSSLVCQSWRPDSQRALFRTLRLHLRDKSMRDIITFFHDPENEGNMPQRHVRDLTITANNPPTKKGSAVTMQELLQLLIQIPALQILTLHGLALEYDHETLTPRRQPLDCLALKSVFGFGTRDGLISAILSICSPRTLCLTQLGFDTTSPQIPWPIPHISGITTLTLRSRWSIVPFLEIFKQGAVQDLRVSCYVTSDVQALGEFLAEAGHQLRRFSIDLTDFIMRTPNRTSGLLHTTSDRLTFVQHSRRTSAACT